MWMTRKEYLLAMSDGGGGVESGNARQAPVGNDLTPNLDLDRHTGLGDNRPLYF